MSRCFPYPPPGYCRNGATHEALIGMIKLQKETAKAERKKEKREKKERKDKRKEKRKEEEKLVIQKNQSEFQPNLKEACFEKTEPKTVTNLRTEHLEKSDLTEEHCQPTNSQKPSYSSDSTQNSNKRKRDEVSIPDGPSGHGKPIKIRILKKHKPDSDKEVLCTDSGRSNTTCLAGADAGLKPVSSNRTAGVPVTSGRENIPVNGLQVCSKQSDPSLSASPSLPLTRLKHDIPSSYSNKTNVQVPSKLKNSDVKGLPSSRQQPVSGYGKPPNKVKSISAEKRPICEITVPDNSCPTRLVKNEERIPSFLSNKPDAQIPSIRQQPNQNLVSRSDYKETKSISTGKRPEITVPDNTCPTRSVKRKNDLISDIPKNVLPCSSGPTRVEKKNEKLISALTRHEKKLQKKYSKYKKVIGRWVPPVLEAQLPDDDGDWLSRKGVKVANSSKDDVETGRELAPSLWQPCARYLAEGDIYALPYTVPF